MKSEVQARLGRRMKALREARGFTQEQLAERCDFTVKFISSIERGLVNLPLGSLATIAHGLVVSVAELTLGIDGTMPREVRGIDQLLAGRSRREQVALAKLLTAMHEMIEEAKRGDAE